MPSILSLYIARRMLASIAVSFFAIFALIFLIEFVEMIRRAKDASTATLFDLLVIAFQRTPLVSEEVLPFTVLFAAIGAFISLSRRMELVVARATGVSIWQMVMPAMLAAALFGMAITALYNPLATYLKERASDRQIELQAGLSAPDDLRWIRQQSVDGQSIIRADSSSDRGRSLTGVTAFVFSPSGALEERIEAGTAKLRDGFWEFDSARVTRVGSAPESHPTYLLATNLTPEQIAESLTPASAIAFWDLPAVIALWERTGIPTTRFHFQYQSLIARPALYVSMVLIAATVALGFSRLGSAWRAILGGVCAGFVLYVGSKMAGDLGAAGFIAPSVAAWSPAVVGILMSVTVLLFQEDG